MVIIEKPNYKNQYVARDLMLNFLLFLFKLLKFYCRPYYWV